MRALTTKDRVLGCLIGEAIGDALGYPVEFDNIDPKIPKVLDLIPRNTDWDGKKVAFYSDDTQMTIAVMEGLISSNTDHITNVSKELIDWANDPSGGHRAPGGACLFGCQQMSKGVPPREAGKGEPNGGGCGAVMRSAPYGLYFNNDFNKAIDMAADHACMTHNTAIGRASSAALAAAIVTSFNTRNPYWIAERAYVAAARYDYKTASLIALATFFATSEGQRLHTETFVLDKFRGWAGHEAIAASIYCFLRYPFSYDNSVFLAVNSPGDSDSLGAITGAISGSFLGLSAIRNDWIARIEKRDQLFDLAGRFTDIIDPDLHMLESEK